MMMFKIKFILNATNITQSYWELLYELKNNQLTSEIPLSLINIQSDSKKLYLFNTFEIIIGPQNIDKLKYCIDLARLNNNEGKKILWLGENTVEKEDLIKQLANDVEIYISTEIEQVNNDIDEIKPDLLIVDAIIQNKTTLKFISYFQQSSKIPIIATIPENIDELEKQKLISEVDALVVDFGKSPAEIFRTIDQNISLMKKLKKSISFPIENKNLSDNEEEIAPLIASKNETKYHVLAVDDDEDTLFTVGEIIKNIGCSISFAKNGAECLTLLKKISPDLILLDIMMPVLDGFETIKKIRSEKKTKELIVYAMTAQAMLDDFDIIKDNGFDDLITKPIDNSTLSFKIQQRIQKK
jgi:CheY-like chemotaxis protein